MGLIYSENMESAVTPSAWTSLLPGGAVSVQSAGKSLTFRESSALQERFEHLLERKKSSSLSEAETEGCHTICQLEDTLSWLNRLARDA